MTSDDTNWERKKESGKKSMCGALSFLPRKTDVKIYSYYIKDNEKQRPQDGYQKGGGGGKGKGNIFSNIVVSLHSEIIDY